MDDFSAHSYCVDGYTNIVYINPCNFFITGITSVNGRQAFVIGEEVSLMCTAIPSNRSVTWEVRRGASAYVAVNDSLVRYEPPSLRTVLRFNASSINAGGGYRCRGTGQLENNTSGEIDVNVLPGTRCMYKHMYSYIRVVLLLLSLCRKNHQLVYFCSSPLLHPTYNYTENSQREPTSSDHCGTYLGFFLNRVVNTWFQHTSLP